MPRQRFARLPVERQEKILEVAGREFAFHGYEGASLNRVLREAGVSKGAAYYYFEDKSDLYFAVIDHYWDRLMESAVPGLEEVNADSFWDAVDGAYRDLFERCVENPWILGLAWSVWKLPSEVRAGGRAAKVFELLEGWYLSIVDRGQELGVMRADLPRDLVVSLMAAMDETNGKWLRDRWDRFTDPGREALQTHTKMLEMVRGMFAPPGAGNGNGVLR